MAEWIGQKPKRSDNARTDPVITAQTAGRLLSMVCAKVQPYLEANGPTLNADVNTLKSIQSLATRLVRGPHHVPFEERLLQLNLFLQERRCLRADLILAFLILKK